MRIVNWRLLLIVLVVFAASSGAVHALHTYQLHRQKPALLREALELQKAGEADRAISALNRYLLLEPANGDALASLGTLLFERGRRSEAMAFLSRALQIHPDRDDLRRTLVSVSLDLNQLQAAEYQLEEFLLKSHPQDSKLLLQLGQSRARRGQFASAVESLESALKFNSAETDAVIELVRLDMGPLENRGRAVQRLNQLVEKNPDHAAAFRIRGQFLIDQAGHPEIQQAVLGVGADSGADVQTARTLKLHERARLDATRAQELTPDDPDVLILAASAAHALRDDSAAARLAATAMDRSPQRGEPYSILASIELAKSPPNSAAAMELLSQGLAAAGYHEGLIWSLASLKIADGDVPAARELIARMRGVDQTTPVMQFLEARILIVEQHWRPASQILESIRPLLSSWPMLAKEADYWACICYEQLGRPDLQLIAAQRAVNADPFFVAARLQRASALMATGQTDAAISEYQEAARLPGASRSLPLNVVRLAVLRNVQRHSGPEEWAAVDRYLADLKTQAAADNSALVSITILEAETHLARGDAQRALQQLQGMHSTHPTSAELTLALASLQQRLGNWDEAEQLLTTARTTLADPGAAEIAWVRYLAARKGNDAFPELRQLWSESAKLAAADRVRLARQLATISMALGDADWTEQLSRFVAEQQTSNLGVRLLLFDLALRSGRKDGLESILNEVKAIEGEGPLWKYGEAVRLAAEGQDTPTSPSLVRALQLLDDVAVVWPRWPQVPLLRGRIRELQHATEDAFAAYESAVRLGHRDAQLLLRLVVSLYDRGDLQRAAELLRQVDSANVPFSAELAQVASSIATRLGDSNQDLDVSSLALALSKSALEQEPDNVSKQVLYGQVLHLNHRDAEAEQILRDATRKHPGEPLPWLVLIDFLVQANRGADARQVVADLEASSANNANFLVLGQAYEQLGDIERAESEFDKVLAQPQVEHKALRTIARFLVENGRTAKAEALLRLLSDPSQAADGNPADALWGRRNLATLLVAKGDFPNLAAARQLLEQTLSQTESRPEDRRLQAIALSRWPTRDVRQSAIPILEQLIDSERNQRSEDRFILASLHLAEFETEQSFVKNLPVGDKASAHQAAAAVHLQAARTRLREAVSHAPNDVRSLSLFAELLIRNQEYAEASVWIDRLESAAPQSLVPALVRSKHLAGQDRFAEAVAVIQSVIDSRSEELQPNHLLMLAERLERIGVEASKTSPSPAADSAFAAAEGLWTRFAQAVPDRAVMFSVYFARRERTEEAITKFVETCPAATDAALAAAAGDLMQRIEDSTQLDRLEQALRQQLASLPDSIALHVALADLLCWRTSTEEAEQQYRKVLAMQPDNSIARNNLAFVLAHQQQNFDEALGLIDEAITAAGPAASLLDTRAVVLLASGKPQEALQVLEECSKEGFSNSVEFHKFQSERALNQSSGDRSASPNRPKFSEQDLHPLERPLLRKMENVP